MNVVLDTGIVVAGIFWKAESHRCLLAFARRRFFLTLTEIVFAEYTEVAWRLKEQQKLKMNPEPWLKFICNKAKICMPALLRRPVCRDPKDDRFLECALAGNARILVSRDKDLLILKKPFGIEIMTPRRFLRQLKESEV